MKDKGAFNPAVMMGLVLAGIVSFAAFLMLIAWGGNRGTSTDSRAHALSVAATGFKALVDLTSAFEETELIRDPDRLDTDDLVVVALEPRNSRREVEALLRRRSGQPTLLILPKWATQPSRSRPGWVDELAPSLSRVADELMPDDVQVVGNAGGGRIIVDDDDLRGAPFPMPRAPQVIGGNEIVPLVEVAGRGALVAQLGDEPHYVVADPDLLNNQGLANADTAVAALALLGALSPRDAGAIHFDLTMNGFTGAGRGLLRTMLEPPFLALTLALAAAALLAGLHGAVRFGAPRPASRAIPLGKAALVENSAGLIRLAGREVRVGSAYVDLVREDAARASAAPPDLHGEALDRYLDRLGTPDRPRFSDLAARLRGARDAGSLVAAARALFQWKKDLIR